MIYVIGNSVSLRNPPTYGDLLGATKVGPDTLYTIINAELDTRNLKLGPNDWVIFNVGVNDCILRKSKKVQVPLIRRLAEVRRDEHVRRFFLQRLEAFENKPDDALLQLLSYDEFDRYCDKVFARFPGRGIVMSVNWISSNNKYIGWAVPQLIQTNLILCRNARKYRMPYVNMWNPDFAKYVDRDGVHLTQEGHQKVYEIIAAIVTKRAVVKSGHPKHPLRRHRAIKPAQMYTR